MMSPKQKTVSKILSVISLILLIIALFLGSSMVTVGTSMYSNVDAVKLEATSFCEEPVTVKGIVTKASFEENTFVDYEYDGNQYTTEQLIYSDECAAGSEVEVYVNPDKPSDVRVPDVFIPVYRKFGKNMMLAGLGISVGLSAISVILILINRSMKIKSRKSD